MIQYTEYIWVKANQSFTQRSHPHLIGSIMGIGFASWTGDTLELINQYGARASCDKAFEFAERFVSRFTPCHLIQEKAQTGDGF